LDSLFKFLAWQEPSFPVAREKYISQITQLFFLISIHSYCKYSWKEKKPALWDW